MARRVAFKQLAAVEIDPTSSNQHELNAGSLRRELGFGASRTSGQLRLVVYMSDEPGDVGVGEGQFTLYDAREAHPTRSEWRLYYDLVAFRGALPGDLLLLFRESDDSLTGIVARQGTAVEATLRGSLSRGDIEGARQFGYVDAPRLSQREMRPLAEGLEPATPGEPAYTQAVAALIADAIVSGRIPGTREMARIAGLAVEHVHGSLPPDLELYHGLEAETDVYFAIEQGIQSPRLAELQESQTDFTAVASFVLSTLQSRRSRRGQSLQNHFALLLDRAGIPYTPQCETEQGEVPDFVLPGCAQYHDASYPAGRLRMVACKSTARERWRQILHEATRIPGKHLLTVDTGLTPSTLDSMRRAALRVFMPAPIITNVYAAHAAGIETVSELLDDLRAGSGHA